MKSILVILLVFLSALSFAQSSPQHFNYQTLIRNNDGSYVANSDVYLRISIIQESPSGTIIYTEEHQSETNDYGLINLKIGEGQTSDDFSSILWGEATMFVKVEASVNDNMNYFEVGVSPFSSVPYALYAEKTASAYKVPSGTGILSFDGEAPDGYGFSGNTITTTKLEGTWSNQIAMPTARRYPAVCTLGNDIYVIGGESESNFTTNHVEVYNILTNTWSTSSSIPLARNHSAAVSHNGKIYVCAGFQSGSNLGSSRTDVYDPQLGTWSTIADLNNARWGHSLMLSNGKMYAVGGMVNTIGDCVGNIEEYDFSKNTWTIIATIPEPLKGEMATILDDEIYLVSGASSIGDSYLTSNRVIAYNLDKQLWEQKTPINNGRVGHTVGIINERLIVCGGSFNGNYLSSTLTYDPITTTWFEENNMSYPKASLRSTTLNDEFWVFGGQRDGFKLSEVESMKLDKVSETMFIHTSK